MQATQAKLVIPLDFTHDPALTSWVESANAPGTDFPIQNLPIGVFARNEGEAAGEKRIGMAIGDSVLDMMCVTHDGAIFNVETDSNSAIAAALQQDHLNPLMALGAPARRGLRQTVSWLLALENRDTQLAQRARKHALIPASSVTMHMPARVGHYIDCYTSPDHAAHVAAIFRPTDPPLMPNFLRQPIAYNGDPRSVVLSGTPIRRPWGQQAAVPGKPETIYAPERNLDYEAELGFFLGVGTALNDGRITMEKVWDYLFGMNILNDWSARAIQAFEYVPLGPWNGKSFGTSISPWVVMSEALLPFMQAKPALDPRFTAPPTLPYLTSLHDFALDVAIEVYIQSEEMRQQGIPEHQVSRGSSLRLAWDFAQMLVQHNGVINPGDLIASGTISGEEDDTLGCLLERRQDGRAKLILPGGEERVWLADGDEVIMRASLVREGARRIGLGEVRGRVLAAYPG